MVTLEEMLGHTTAIAVATRESGEVVGNSLKTIYSRITTMDTSIDTLRDLGVATHEMIDGFEQVRSVSDILGDLAGKWNTLSAAEQQNAGVKLAGRFQLSRFLVLMQNWQMGVEATESALNSQGSAMKENAEYMKSLEARINRLKTAWEVFSLSLGDAIITDTFTSIVESLTGGLRLLRIFTDNFGVLPALFSAVGTSFFIFSKAFKAFILDLAKSVAAIFGIVPATAAATTGIDRLTAATTRAAKATSTLKTAIRGLMVTTGVGIAFTAIGVATEFLVNKFSNLSDSFNKVKQEFSEEISSLNSHKQGLVSLISEYERLNSQNEKTIDQENRLWEIKKLLVSEYGVAVQAVNAQGEAYTSDIDLAKQRVHWYEEEIKAKKELAMLEYQEREATEIEGVLKKRDALQKLIDEEREHTQAIEELNKEFFTLSLMPLEELNKLSRMEKIHRDDRLREINNEVQEREKAQQAILKNLPKHSAEYNLAVTQIAKETSEAFNLILNGLEENGLKVSDKTRAIIYEWAKIWASEGKTIEEASGDVTKIALAMANLPADANINDLLQMFSRLNMQFDTNSDSMGNFSRIMKDIPFTQIDDDIDSLNEKMGEMSQASKDLISETNTLASAYETLQKGEQLSHETLLDLIAKYPEFAKYLNENNGLIKDKGALLEWIANRDREVFLEEQRLLLESNNNTLNSLNAKRNMYHQFYEAFLGARPIEEVYNNVINQGLTAEEKLLRQKLEEERAQLEATIKLFSKPITLASWKGSSSSSSKKEKTATEIAAEQRKEAYQLELAELQHLITMQELSTSVQIKRYDDLAKKHKQHLSEERSAERSHLENLKSLRDKYAQEQIEIDRKIRQHAIDSLNKELDHSKRVQSVQEEGSQPYIAEINKQNTAYGKLKDAVHAEAEALRNRLKAGKLTSEQVQDLNTRLVELSDIWFKSEKAIQDNTSALQRFNEEQQKVAEEQRKLLEENYKQQQSALQSAADEAINALKEYYRAEQKVREDALKKAKKELDKAHKENTDRLDDELKQFEEVANAQLKALRKDEETSDYNKELNKAQDEAQKLRDLISERELDTTAETQAAVRKMREELAEKEEAITEMVHKHGVKLREENLQDAIDAKRKEIQDQKDNARYTVEINGKMHDDLYDNLVQRIDEEQEALDTYYNEALNNEQKFATLREEVLQGNLTNLQTTLSRFASKASETMQVLGDNIQQNLIDKLNQASVGLSQANMNITPNGGNVSEQQAYNADFQRYITNKVNWEKEYQATGKMDSTNQKRLSAENDQLRLNHGYIDYDINQIRNMNYDWLKKLMPFESGGYTGNFEGGKIGLLHKKELILNKADTSNLLKIVDVVRGITDKIKLNAPNLSNIAPSRNLATESASATFHFDKFIHVDKIEKDVDFDQLMNKWNNKMKQAGFTFGFGRR